MNSVVSFVDPPERDDRSRSVDFPRIAGVGCRGDSDLQAKAFGGI